MNRNLKDCIPINFLGGSGGSFLCSFLTAAKYNDQVKFVFTEYSGMHTLRYSDIPTHIHGPDEHLMKKLQFIISSDTLKPDHKPPYFTTIHAPDTNEILSYFDKVIHISIDESDLNDISCCLVLKLHGTEDEILIKNYKSYAKRYSGYFEVLNSDKVLNISWKDILYNDPDILVSKLSGFTEIPISNFNLDNLINWRSGTKETIELGNKYIIGG